MTCSTFVGLGSNTAGGGGGGGGLEVAEYTLTTDVLLGSGDPGSAGRIENFGFSLTDGRAYMIVGAAMRRVSGVGFNTTATLTVYANEDARTNVTTSLSQPLIGTAFGFINYADNEWHIGPGGEESGYLSTKALPMYSTDAATAWFQVQNTSFESDPGDHDASFEIVIHYVDLGYTLPA